jgi:putative colanic acid biosynthesis acetyltransferase WcaF
MRDPLRPNHLSSSNRIARTVWSVVWLLLFRPTPRTFHPWRCFLLRLFGAKLGKAVHPYPSARIWAPWNLEMGDHACLSEEVDCYCVEKIRNGANSTVSQYSFLCSASHDYSSHDMPLVTAPITIGNRVWIAADVFVGPGVRIGDGTVVTARSSVFGSLPGQVVARGNPAIPVRQRLVELRAAGMRLPITVIVAVKNEALNIRRCLASLQPA